MSASNLPEGVEPWEVPLLEVAECDEVGAAALLELHDIHRPEPGIGPAPEYCEERIAR